MEKSINKKVVRCIRNNNPLNIRRSTEKWIGLCEKQTDKDFCQFKTMEYGWRAAFRLLTTYYEKYECNTIKKLITRWAPPCENPTAAYIQYVETSTDIRRDFHLWHPKDDTTKWMAIAIAMFEYESGMRSKHKPIGQPVIKGYQMAMR